MVLFYVQQPPAVLPVLEYVSGIPTACMIKLDSLVRTTRSFRPKSTIELATDGPMVSTYQLCQAL